MKSGTIGKARTDSAAGGWCALRFDRFGSEVIEGGGQIEFSGVGVDEVDGRIKQANIALLVPGDQVEGIDLAKHISEFGVVRLDADCFGERILVRRSLVHAQFEHLGEKEAVGRIDLDRKVLGETDGRRKDSEDDERKLGNAGLQARLVRFALGAFLKQGGDGGDCDFAGFEAFDFLSGFGDGIVNQDELLGVEGGQIEVLHVFGWFAFDWVACCEREKSRQVSRVWQQETSINLD